MGTHAANGDVLAEGGRATERERERERERMCVRVCVCGRGSGGWGEVTPSQPQQTHGRSRSGPAPEAPAGTLAWCSRGTARGCPVPWRGSEGDRYSVKSWCTAWRPSPLSSLSARWRAGAGWRALGAAQRWDLWKQKERRGWLDKPRAHTSAGRLWSAPHTRNTTEFGQRLVSDRCAACT